MGFILPICYFFCMFKSFYNKKGSGKKNIKSKHFMSLLLTDCLMIYP